MGIAGGCRGVQWELPGAVARGDQSHASVSFSVPARRRAFCPDGDLGSSNRPFSLKDPVGAQWELPGVCGA